MEQGKGLLVILVSVQVQTQLVNYKAQRLQLDQGGFGHRRPHLLQVEGQVQAGKQGALAQSLLGTVLGCSGLLEGDIGNRQRRAVRHGAKVAGARRR